MHGRKGEKGNLVVDADRIRRTELDDKGEKQERDIPFMKGDTAFDVEQIEGRPALRSNPETLYASRATRKPVAASRSAAWAKRRAAERARAAGAFQAPPRSTRSAVRGASIQAAPSAGAPS